VNTITKILGSAGLVTAITLGATGCSSLTGSYINTSHLQMDDWGSFSSSKQTAIARAELHAWHDNGSVSDMKQTLDDAFQSDTDPGCSVDFAADNIEAGHLANYTHLEHTCDSATTGSETNIDGQVITPKAAPAPVPAQAAPAPAPAQAAPAPVPAQAAPAPAPAPVTPAVPPTPDPSLVEIKPATNDPVAAALLNAVRVGGQYSPGAYVQGYILDGQYAIAGMNFHAPGPVGDGAVAYFVKSNVWRMTTLGTGGITAQVAGMPTSTFNALTNSLV
jgi:hypothetical protein